MSKQEVRTVKIGSIDAYAEMLQRLIDQQYKIWSATYEYNSATAVIVIENIAEQ